MSALQGAMRAEARKAIVRVPDLGCENLLKYWNRLSVPDRRWAVGRLGTLDVQRRVDLLVLGLNDRSEVVVVEALTVLERARELRTCERFEQILERLKYHPSSLVRGRMTRCSLTRYRWPNALHAEPDSQVRRLLIRRAFEDLSSAAVYACLGQASSMDQETVEAVLYHASLVASLSPKDLRFLRQHPVDSVRAAAQHLFE